MMTCFFSFTRAENPTLMNPLQPCCEGVSMEYSCGSVDEKGEKKYCLCKKPELSFFWEGVHLSQNGWYAVYMMLYSSLSKLWEKTLIFKELCVNSLASISIRPIIILKR